ncbi:hypothetical protein U1Q18_020025 [Sarracenia purpurea var. burkii]
MEKQSENTTKQEKKKMVIGIGGGGGGGSVGGVVLWGGLMAIATLISVSAIRLRKKRLPNKGHHPTPPPSPVPPPPPQAVPSADVSNNLDSNTNIDDDDDDDDQEKGLRVLLHDSSPPTQIDSTSLDFTKSLILDANSVIDINAKNEKPTYLDILLGDKSKPESPLASDHVVKVQKLSLPMSDGAFLLAPGKEIEVLHTDLFAEEHPKKQLVYGKEVIETIQKDQLSVEEAIETTQKNQLVVKEAIETTQKDQFGIEFDLKAEDDSQIQLIEEGGGVDDGENAKEKGNEEAEKIEDDPMEILSEEEYSYENDVDGDEDEDEDDGSVEKGEESSEGTENTSMESIAEAIWPAESIEELSMESNELKIGNHKMEEEIQEYGTEENGGNDFVKNVGVYENGRRSNEHASISMMNSSKKTLQELLTRINSSMELSGLGIWIWSTSVVLLLGMTVAVVVAPLLLICFIIFTVVVLSHV